MALRMTFSLFCGRLRALSGGFADTLRMCRD
jgi:hypothetical protein